MERAAGRSEYLDGPLVDAQALRENLRDLARVNRLLGGTAISRSALVRAFAGSRPPSPLRLLDVGTGSADIPAALVAWGRKHGLEIEATGVDSRHEILEVARSLRGDRSGVRLELTDGERLPYPDRSFDVAHASLVLHHLEPGEAEAFLAELARVASRAVIVNDLDRRRHWWVLARLLAAVSTKNRYTRHDAPLSVRRAYRPDELIALAARVGLVPIADVRVPLGHRYAIAFAPRASEGARPANQGMWAVA